MTRLGSSPTDRCFIQILKHILLAGAPSRQSHFVLRLPSCIVSFFMVSLIYL